MNVDDLLKTAVDDAVRDLPPGFADAAIRRGRRARRTARIAAAGGTAVVVAAAVAGIAVVDAPSADVEPAGDGVVDLGGLGTGPAPQVPWYEDGVLHVGDRTTRADLSSDTEPADPVIHRVRDGYVVWIWAPVPDAYGSSTLTLIRDDGEQRVLAEGDVTAPVVSPDGERIAWGLPDHDWITDGTDEEDQTSTVMVADATGAVVAELPDAPSPGIRPYGFLDDGRLVLEASGTTAWGLYAWPPGGEVTPLRDGVGLMAMSPTGDLAVLSEGRVSDLATGADLWRLDDGVDPALSPDGRYLATSRQPVGAGGPGELVIHDARTGDEQLRLELGSIDVLRWESPTTVVIDVTDDAGSALVRCTVGGECELATELRPAAGDAYVLG